MWPRIAELLDPARTTIFNGHWHALSYGVQDGIPTYVLPATGAEVGTTNRELGSVQVLTHVTVHGGKPGEGTGQVMLGVPSAGEVPKPEWAMGKRRIPEGLDIAIVRREGGYICELSLPLSELGCRLPLGDGDGINLEVQIDDRDILPNGRAAVSHASSSGVPNSFQNTHCYARGTIRK